MGRQTLACTARPGMGKMGRLTTLGALCLALAGCSALDAINPFSSEPKVKMAELQPFTPRLDVRPVWQASVGKAEDNVFVPALVDDQVYAAGRKGTLARISGGKDVWRIDVGQPLSGGVASDGRMVVVGTSKGDLLAFDAQDGKALWNVKVGTEVLAPPAIGENLVVVRGGDNRLFAFDRADGKRRWVYQRNNPPLALRTYASPVISDRFVFAGFPGGKVVAVSLNNGAASWEGTVALPKGATELDRVADVVARPVIDGREVCAVAFQGRVACFDLSNGNLEWARDLSSSVGLTLDARYVYVTDDKGYVQALDRFSGAFVWKQDKLAGRGLTPPLVSRGAVVVADSKGFVHYLSRDDGAFIGRAATDGSEIVAPTLALGASSLLVQTRNGGLFALDAQ